MADISLDVTLKGFKELDQALQALPEAIAGQLMADALRDAGEVIRVAAAQNIHSRTGRTAADIRVEVQAVGDAGAAAVGGTLGKTGRAHILRWLEFGTRAHRIPKRRKAKPLSFLGIVRRSVMHPATAGQSPLTRALAEQGDHALDVFRERLWLGLQSIAARYAGRR